MTEVTEGGERSDGGLRCAFTADFSGVASMLLSNSGPGPGLERALISCIRLGGLLIIPHCIATARAVRAKSPVT
jgi:hypothetical protein